MNVGKNIDHKFKLQNNENQQERPMTAIKICLAVRNDSSPLWDSLLFQYKCDDDGLPFPMGEITITGRNSRNILSHRLRAEDESKIEPFLFKGSTMFKILKECPDDEITLTNVDHILTISFDVSFFEFHVDTLQAMDFINTLPDYGEEKAAMAIPVYLIKDHPKAWDSFASTDELRTVMQFISIESGEGEMNLVATNAHLLFNLKSEWHGEPQSFLLPSKMISKLCKFIPKQDIHIKKYEKQWAAAIFGSTTLLYYYPDDRYPKWQQVIPEDTSNTIRFLAVELKSAIRQIHTVSNTSTHQIIMYADDKDGILIKTHDFDFDQSGMVRLRRTIMEGHEINIGFNCVLLQQCLDALTGTEITMTYTTANRAVIFRGNGNKDTLALLMPVMVDDRR